MFSETPRVESFTMRFVQDAPEEGAPRLTHAWHGIIMRVRTNENRAFKNVGDALTFISQYVDLGDAAHLGSRGIALPSGELELEKSARGLESPLRIQTLGGFRVWRNGSEVNTAAWNRGKALQLFQFLVTSRRNPQHKEQIIDQLWPELDAPAGDRDFRVALNAIYRALEPERQARAQSRFVKRYDLAYGLDLEQIWVDANAFEQQVALANQFPTDQLTHAIEHFRAAVEMYAGEYLPERRYEDWSSAERERLETLAVATMTILANLLTVSTPLESLRLTQRALSIDPVWEDAYRVQMRAYLQLGNRPLALRTFQKCGEVLEREFGIQPLPETRALHEQIKRE